MAGPDNLEPVTASWQPGDAKDIPVKASPPREKSPTVSEVKEGAAGGEGEGGAMPSSSSVTPPDGGWGWAVVFASFMIHIIGRLARLWCLIILPHYRSSLLVLTTTLCQLAASLAPDTFYFLQTLKVLFHFVLI